jgi:hypothetical protein
LCPFVPIRSPSRTPAGAALRAARGAALPRVCPQGDRPSVCPSCDAVYATSSPHAHRRLAYVRRSPWNVVLIVATVLCEFGVCPLDRRSERVAPDVRGALLPAGRRRKHVVVGVGVRRVAPPCRQPRPAARCVSGGTARRRCCVFKCARCTCRCCVPSPLGRVHDRCSAGTQTGGPIARSPEGPARSTSRRAGPPCRDFPRA